MRFSSNSTQKTNQPKRLMSSKTSVFRNRTKKEAQYMLRASTEDMVVAQVTTKKGFCLGVSTGLTIGAPTGGTARSTTCKTRSCCKCNGSGVCRNCSCVKAGMACTNCLPSRRKGCRNPRNCQLMPGLVSTTSVGESAAPSTSTSADSLVSSSLGSGAGEAADPQLTPTPLTDDGIRPTCQPVDNNLPVHVPMTNPQFRWGELNAPAVTSLLDTAYKEVVHWRRNCFTIPKGNTGKAFVNELARLFAAFASGTTLESVSIKATIVLPHLVLQKPHRSSKP